ncbi:MAG: hypothetical protein RR641_07035 [Erysipelotrichaceae bacterium]
MKNIILSTCLMMMFITPNTMSMNSTDKQILVLSPSLPQVFIITITKDNYHVALLPKKTNIKLTCMKDTITTIDNINLKEMGRKCLINTLNDNFDLKIKNDVILNFNNIKNDFNIDIKNKNLNDFTSILEIFHQVSGQITFDKLINYQKYVSTTMDFNLINQLYQLYKEGNHSVKYYYPHLYKNQLNEYIPFETSFYLQK